MQALIDRIADATGVDRARAEKALGITLAVIRTAGSQARAQELIDLLPGAAELITRHGGEGYAPKGGLFGSLMSGPVAAQAQLQGLGLSPQQIRQLTSLTLEEAKRLAGPDVVKAVIGSIPALGGYA